MAFLMKTNVFQDKEEVTLTILPPYSGKIRFFKKS